MSPEEIPVAEDILTALAPARYPFWGWADLFMFLGLLTSFILALLLAMKAATMVWPSLITNQVPLILPSQLALYVAIYIPLRLVFRLRHDKPVFSSLGWKNVVPNQKLTLFGLGGLILSPTVALIASALHAPVVVMDVVAQLQGHTVILALLAITAVTIGPLFEELLFRGFIQPLFSSTFGVIAGILLTSVIFGALHSFQYKLVWQYVAAVSLVGAVLGVVRYRTGSLIPSTVMHCCFNLIASFGIFFPHK